MPDMHAEHGLSRAPSIAAGPGVFYTCQMHPQIRRSAPGHCPICGMTLEPEKLSAMAAPGRGLAEMAHRFRLPDVISFLYGLVASAVYGWSVTIIFVFFYNPWPSFARIVYGTKAVLDSCLGGRRSACRHSTAP